ncbi:MAG: proline--tRNA ligase [Ignavibacteria bacterium RBG_16_34_14]|nr:MAG: proline--tRNA ligase [Ignavibacteria bacterium RBG_16_34_14]
MRFSKSFIPTLRETPSEAVVTSHILMLRSGMIRMVAAGIYSFLPTGYRVIRKISEIIREEMNAIGGQEFHLPALNPKEIWEETGRVEAFGDILFHVKNREYVLAPTHEEIMTFHARNVLKSYKDFPQIWYQIQTKFRNEPRPRSGVIRGRQFLMKDAYSFDISPEGLDKSYELHDQAYRKIFDRCGLKYFVVGASSGAMGGSGSEEFMVKSDAGEDTVAHCDNCGYAANVEVAESKVPSRGREEKNEELKEIHTPNIRSINELCEFLKIKETQCAKSRIYVHLGKPVLIFMLGNEEVNESKLVKYLGGAVRPAHPEELVELTGAEAGSIGPVGFNGRIIADLRLKDANNLYGGANKTDYHYGGIDFTRDAKNIEYADLRRVVSEEGCIKCNSPLQVFTAIELGHIFKLGTKYSEAMGAMFLDEKGEEHPIIMGSYGIGADRVMACFIEQHHDEKGIIWDTALAPFHVHLMGLNLKNEEVAKACEEIYKSLTDNSFDVLFDDRNDAQAGVKFNDADLLGMPLQIIVGDRKLKTNQVEVKIRKTGERFDVELDKLMPKLKEIWRDTVLK